MNAVISDAFSRQSDRGVQHASAKYLQALEQLSILPSQGSPGDRFSSAGWSMSRPATPYDNARCESFIRTVKREEIRDHQYRNLDDLRIPIPLPDPDSGFNTRSSASSKSLPE